MLYPVQRTGIQLVYIKIGPLDLHKNQPCNFPCNTPFFYFFLCSKCQKAMAKYTPNLFAPRDHCVWEERQH